MKRLFGLLLVFGVAGCAAWNYLGYRLSPDYPQEEDDTLVLAGLERPVPVYFDELGVPHVEAEDETDLLRTVGFLHGRARFFQMDVLRRYATGRLSELFGDQTGPSGSVLAQDMAMRGFGLGPASRRLAVEADGEARALLEAYVAGINAARERYLPIEYRLLGTKPEPWTVADTFAVGALVGWGITHNWRHELCRLLLALSVGAERAERIFPSEPWPAPPALGGEWPGELPPSVVPEVKGLFPGRPLPAEEKEPLLPNPVLAAVLEAADQGASNGWVLGGGRTVSGKPLLAGDPHLSHLLPSIFFQQHLKCSRFDVIGVTVPGLPYVLIGRNQRVAWTLTAAVADVTDLYLEKLVTGRLDQVLGPDGPEPMEQVREVFRIRDGKHWREQVKIFRRTKRGPLLNDFLPDVLGADAPLVSLHGVETSGAEGILALRRAASAGNVAELREALGAVPAPVNIVQAADADGAIALFATGKVPRRTGHRGTFPAPAWVAGYQWPGLVEARGLVRAGGGEGDFFVHANNLVLAPGAGEVLFQVDSAPSYRRDRIQELLAEKDRHDVESLSRIQTDVLLLRARSLLPVMLQDLGTGTDAREKDALRRLGAWDFQARADSVACSIFFATYREAAKIALQDEVDARAMHNLLSFRYFSTAIDLWFADAAHPVWDDRRTPETEQRAQVLRAAFPRALDWLAERLGEDADGWRWGELHALELQHPFGEKAAAFSLERFPAPGALDSVWKAQFDLGGERDPFGCRHGPVLRWIADLSPGGRSAWIIDTGASGWPGSPHYADQHRLWRRGQLEPMLLDGEEIRSHTAGILQLEPASGTAP